MRLRAPMCVRAYMRACGRVRAHVRVCVQEKARASETPSSPQAGKSYQEYAKAKGRRHSHSRPPDPCTAVLPSPSHPIPVLQYSHPHPPHPRTPVLPSPSRPIPVLQYYRTAPCRLLARTLLTAWRLRWASTGPRCLRASLLAYAPA